MFGKKSYSNVVKKGGDNLDGCDRQAALGPSSNWTICANVFWEGGKEGVSWVQGGNKLNNTNMHVSILAQERPKHSGFLLLFFSPLLDGKS